MKARLIAGLAAAALLIGCGGGGSSVQPQRSQLHPDAAGTFTLQYPANVVRAGQTARRAPRFLDPTANAMLYVSVVGQSFQSTYADVCFAVSPQSDGSQQVTIPLFSRGGTIGVYEYASGTPATCSATGALLAQVSNVSYASFTPGTDVAASTLLYAPLTLVPHVSQIIYSVNGGAYSAAQTSEAHGGMCGSNTVQFLGADANSVSVAAASNGASPSPAQNGGFPPVTFGALTFSGAGSSSPITAPGSLSLTLPSPMPTSSPQPPNTATIAVTASDAFQAAFTDRFTFSCP